MYYSLLLRTFNLNNIQFSLTPSELKIDTFEFLVLKNGFQFDDFTLHSYVVNEISFYSLIPFNLFHIDDILQIELRHEFHSSNSIIVIFSKTVESSKTQFDVNFPLCPGEYYFTIDKINNVDFHISTETISTSLPPDNYFSSIRMSDKRSAIVFRNCSFLIDIELLTSDKNPVDDGFYDFDFIIEKKEP